jgi:hypothetical protein
MHHEGYYFTEKEGCSCYLTRETTVTLKSSSDTLDMETICIEI